MERVVLGRRDDSMVRFRWSGDEPEALNDVDLAVEMGATWEGHELATSDPPSPAGCMAGGSPPPSPETAIRAASVPFGQRHLLHVSAHAEPPAQLLLSAAP